MNITEKIKQHKKAIIVIVVIGIVIVWSFVLMQPKANKNHGSKPVNVSSAVYDNAVDAIDIIDNMRTGSIVSKEAYNRLDTINSKSFSVDGYSGDAEVVSLIYRSYDAVGRYSISQDSETLKQIIVIRDSLADKIDY